MKPDRNLVRIKTMLRTEVALSTKFQLVIIPKIQLKKLNLFNATLPSLGTSKVSLSTFVSLMPSLI